MHKLILNFWLVIASIFLLSNCGSSNKSVNQKHSGRSDLRIMFYNVENLFDTIDTPNKADEEFTPESDKRWNSYRYYKKLRNLFQVIAAVGETSAPEIIALAEIENKKVLEDLISKTPLENFPYSIVHYESPDFRGIDVALLYQNDKISLVDSKIYPVVFPENNYFSRDILAVTLAHRNDTIIVFVNHWPSRRGGQQKSEPKRQYAASILKNKTDSIFSTNPNSKIVVTGDFNDEPENISLTQALGALPIGNGNIQSNHLYNLSYALKDSCKCGTYRYRGDWNMLDQFLISGSLLEKKGLYTTQNDIHIYSNPLILKDDTRYGGYYPYRTYTGPRYQGGYSDHLPVYIDLYFEE